MRRSPKNPMLGSSLETKPKNAEKTSMERVWRLLWSFVVIAGVGMALGCKYTGGKVEGTVNRGVLDTIAEEVSTVWDFRSAENYTFDSSFVEISGNSARLKTVSTTFNSASSFNGGTYVGTKYLDGALKPLTTADSSLGLDRIVPNKSSRLVGYWKFENNMADSSTSAAGATVGSDVSYKNEKKIGNYSALFTNTGTSFASVGSSSTYISSANQKFTIVAWINPTAISSSTITNRIFSVHRGVTPGSSLSLGIGNSGKFGYYNYSDNSYTTSTTTFSVGQWTHIALTYDGTCFQMFVNGTPDGGCAPKALAAGGAYLAGLGAFNPGSGNQFVGYLDELAIWSDHLTTAEIETIYRTQNQTFANDTSLSSIWTPQWSNLVGYWSMDRNWQDSSGNGHHGTASGATIVNTSKVGLGAGRFDGVYDEVSFAGASLTSVTNEISFGGWFKLNSDTATTTGNDYRTIFSRTASFGIILEEGTTPRRMRGSVYVDGTRRFFDASLNSKSLLGGWHHVLYTANPNQGWIRAYVDGVYDGETTYAPGSLDTNTYDVKFSGGANGPSGDHRWPGLLDDFAMWNTALKPEHVAMIYNRQKQKYAGSYDSPVIDMGANGAPWTNLASVTKLPFYKNLPTSAESGYSSLASSLSTYLSGAVYFEGTSLDALGNTTTLLGNPLYSEGVIGKSLELDGNGDGVRLSPAANFDKPANGSMTWSAWINFSSTPTASVRALFSKRNTAVPNEGFEFTQDSTGVINFRVDDGPTSLNMTSNTVFTSGTWYHVLFKIDGSSASIYVNGKLDKTSTNSTYANALASTSDLYVGYDGRAVSGVDDLAGKIDEVALWARALSPSEVVELYRRGANRIKYQVRSCVDSACSCKSYSVIPAGSAVDCDGDGVANGADVSDSYAAAWIGPDGTASTYFSELQNNVAVDASGGPTGSVKTTGLNLDWSGAFFASAARPTNNRYFQYRVNLEADDDGNLCSGSPCLPEVTTISVGTGNRYFGGSPTIINKVPVSFTQLQTMTSSDDSSCATYQISNDGGATWKWWDGSTWSTATGGVAQSNSVSEYTQERLNSFLSGSFKFKVFLNTNSGSDFSHSCSLTNTGITYTP